MIQLTNDHVDDVVGLGHVVDVRLILGERDVELLWVESGYCCS